LDLQQIATVLSLRAQGKTRLGERQIDALRAAMRRAADEFLDACGLTCFSLNASHPLLWGYYGGGYTGICAVFRRNGSMQSGLCLCARVSYVEQRPRLPLSLFYEMRRAQKAGKPTDEMTNKIFFLSFLHKSKEWEHEQEARIYYPFEASNKVRFDRDELIGIIIGPKSSSAFEKRLREEVDKRAPTISIQKAVLSDNDFGIAIPADFTAQSTSASWNAPMR
jgi:hypothetical protein